jgi:hypothetical protein
VNRIVGETFRFNYPGQGGLTGGAVFWKIVEAGAAPYVPARMSPAQGSASRFGKGVESPRKAVLRAVISGSSNGKG